MGQRLAQAQSAYLRQHADNPVDWWPWSPEAFEEARRRDVPVFVSIGYAACHWCHVMAGESFEDPEAARLLAERFVSIKVDREEHPDVDDAYMAAVQAMTGQGGWPMSVFTTPQGQVFHAGTYFPPRRRGRIPSFTEVLDAVHTAWTQRRQEVEQSAEQIAASLGEQRRQQAQIATVVDAGSAQASGLSPEAFGETVSQALEALTQQEDTVHGGFGAAPKFPPSPLLGFLLEEGAHRPQSPAAGLANRTMEAMGRSALFDQVEGGFARYATDRAWSLPHFEKMLYDNAQLIGHYARLSVHPAADQAQRDDAGRITRRSISWLRQRMTLAQREGTSGLLASSLDADTVDEDGFHHEGATYLFSDAEVREAAEAAGWGRMRATLIAEMNRGVPADEHALASGAPLNITEHTPRTLHFDAPLSPAERTLWEKALPELRRRRAARPQPARDEKVVAAWNAQAVASLAQAAVLWEDAELLEEAEQLGERLWAVHVEEDSSGRSAAVYRTSYDGVRGGRLGTLGDHAQVAGACFALASAGVDKAAGWLERGRLVLSFTLRRFLVREGEGEDAPLSLMESLDEGGLLFQAQHGAGHATPFDGPEPSSIAALAQALQTAEALELLEDLPRVRVSTPERADAGLSPEAAPEPLRAADILHHVPFAAPKAPQAVGASMLAAARAARQSPAFRILAGSPQEVAEVRRAGVLHGIPVEPVPPGVVGEGEQLRLSVCLNGQESMLCLPPVGSVQEALAKLG